MIPVLKVDDNNNQKKEKEKLRKKKDRKGKKAPNIVNINTCQFHLKFF